MVSWVIVAIIVIAFLIYAKYTGFRYGKVVTWVIGGVLTFFVITFIFVTTKADLINRLGTYDGFISGMKFYFLWLGNFLSSTSTITGNAISEFSTNVTNVSR